MVRTFVLVGTTVGKTKDVFYSLKKVSGDGIVSVDIVTGDRIDLIVITETSDLPTLGILVDWIHGIEGVVSTNTCVAVP